MSTLREAAQQALEALEGFLRFAAIHSDGPDASDKYLAEDYAEEAFLKAAKVLPDLRTALAQPEPRNQCGETCERAKLCAVCARGLAQQALRDLERAEEEGNCEYASTAALRAALAQEEREQTCNCRWVGDVQTQQCTLHEAHVDAIHEWAERAKAAEAKLAALARQEQAEPVATVTECEACFTPDVCRLRGACDHYSAQKLRVAHPPRREWQSLSEEEIKTAVGASADFWASSALWIKSVARAVEAALKERNT